MTSEIIVCAKCGEDFYLRDTKNTIGRRFYISTYDEFYPEGNVCQNCATEEIGEIWIER